MMRTNKSLKQLLLIALFVIGLSSCTDKDDNPTFGNLQLLFTHQVDNNPLELNNSTYTNQAGEAYNIAEFKYIISNIRLTRADGSTFEIPQEESYFLINEAQANSKEITLTNIPTANYVSVTYGIGVDQSKYPLNGMENFIPQAEEQNMLWSWSAGYKFIKFEGSYNSSGANPDRNFIIHMGSHGTNLDNYKEVTLPINTSISENQTSTINILANINALFTGTTNYKFADKDEIQVDPDFAPIIAANFVSLFSIN